ncbi:MAG: Cyclic AMP receptor protein [Alphaproteobacteria bacterium MarineAlpha3_Bin1]|jgi:CRP/FNR family cyclic AMP-dependent transcriptional regulator|nr:MAG: Cyclic AMP receptor protein [Alphaproteobacteria bacterium MarineAlpha3_Bin1]
MHVDGEILDKKFIPKGDAIFRDGDPGEAAYLIESGTMGIFKTVEGEEIQLATMSDGELLGEMAIIDGFARMAHAIALEDSVVVTIPRAGIDAMLAKQNPLIKTLIQILVDNLRNVHEIYMKRPRSVHDFLNAIDFHAGGLTRNLEHNKGADPTGEGFERLKQIEKQLEGLRDQFNAYRDRRTDVLDEDGEEKQ